MAWLRSRRGVKKMTIHWRGEVGRVVVGLVQDEILASGDKNLECILGGGDWLDDLNHTEDCYASCMGPTYNFSI